MKKWRVDMIRFEMYKLFKRKLILATFIVLILLIILPNIDYIRNYVFDKNEHKNLEYQLNRYEKNKGIITEQRISEFIDGYKWEKNDPIGEFLNDKKIIPIKKIFSKQNFNIHFGYFKLWCFLVDDFQKYIKDIAVFIAIAFSGLFSYEKTCGMQEIIMSSQYGRRKSILARIKGAFLLTNIMLLFAIVIFECTLFLLTHGIGADTSIQMVPWLWDSCLDMRYGQLLIHMFFISFIGINFILLITLCVAFLANNPMAAVCGSVAILFFARPDIINMGVSKDNQIVTMIASALPLNIFDVHTLALQPEISLFGANIQFIKLVEVLYVILFGGSIIYFLNVMTKKQKYCPM